MKYEKILTICKKHHIGFSEQKSKKEETLKAKILYRNY